MVAQTAGNVATNPQGRILFVAWVGTLLASALPAILWREFFHSAITDTVLFRLGIPLILVLLSFIWRTIAPLRRYFILIAAICLGYEVLNPLVGASGFWQRLFGAQHSSFFLSGLGDALIRCLMALIPWAALVLMGYKRQDYFLVTGQLNASAEPVRWLDIKEGERWIHVGRNFLVVFAIVTSGIFFLAVKPTVGQWDKILTLIPAAVLFAAMNAFTENFAYRAALLPQLVPTLGKQQALLLSAVFFGLPHFYGFPPGIGGPILAGFLGWVLGKSMIETKGFLWPWIIQLPLDIMAILTILIAAG